MATENQQLKKAIERATSIFTKKPSMARKTDVSVTRLECQLSCECSEGDWRLSGDMPSDLGGNGKAPTPGVYIRASLGSCLAIGYAMWAARLDVPVRSIEVRVETDVDSGGLLATSDCVAGYSSVNYHVEIDSDATEAQITEVIDSADAHSPILDVFQRPIKCTRTLGFVSQKSDSQETHL